MSSYSVVVTSNPSMDKTIKDETRRKCNDFSIKDISLQPRKSSKIITAKPHPFTGAVLTPKHARDLTPNLVLAIAHTLSEKTFLVSKSNSSTIIPTNANFTQINFNNNINSYNRVSKNPAKSKDSTKEYNAFQLESSLSLEPKINSDLDMKSLGIYEKENTSRNNGNESVCDDDHIDLQDNTSIIINDKVQYTVWITEAWRILGWAEPSAALFWEMATMYHALHVAGREICCSVESLEASNISCVGKKGDNEREINEISSHVIRPMLSCESLNSMDSQDSYHRKTFETSLTLNQHSQVISDNTTLLNLTESPTSKTAELSIEGTRSRVGSGSGNINDNKLSQNSKSTSASAKELPVWLVAMFLLLHCEERAFWRNVSGEDERRFDGLKGGMSCSNDGSMAGEIWKDNLVGKGVDFGMLLLHPSLSPRTRIHAGRHTDNKHCTAYLLRHLRKFLLLAAIPHNPEALWAIINLADTKSPHESEYTDRKKFSSNNQCGSLFAMDQQLRPDSEVLHRCHEEEHLSIGLHVRLTSNDLEKLNLIIQAPFGGFIDDTPLSITELMPSEEMTNYGAISVEEVEQEIRRHLELELMQSDVNDDVNDDPDVDGTVQEIEKLSLSHKIKGTKHKMSDESKGSNVSLKLNYPKEFNKELSYTNLRGKTILLKPDLQTHSIYPLTSRRASINGIKLTSDHTSKLATSRRLHDLHVSDCSDAHLYLLQPFEHTTISACTGCTIVIGAVAGLLHVVDCERTTITSAARRVMVSNCFDVLHCIFTPSPPLLVGDNRSCQFAPYNTYYEGLREDLSVTGLAALIFNLNSISHNDIYTHILPSQCASNKWKQPVELAKLEIPQAHPQKLSTSSPISGGTPGADDKVVTKPGSGDETMQTPILLPASEFNVLFVPLENDTERHQQSHDRNSPNDIMFNGVDSSVNLTTVKSVDRDSQYCRYLAGVLYLSPFRLPTEYERHALIKVERMRNIQQTIQTDLSPEQQLSLKEELNRGFRDWLVTSGNLRQVLDLVHIDRKC